MKNKLFFLILFTSNWYFAVSQARQGNDYAVFFAVEDYDHWDDLRTPIKDSRAISSLLEEKYGFSTEIIPNPTWLEIRDKISALKGKKFNREDQLLLFFTGHGEFIPKDNDPKDGNGYFIPSDAKKNDVYRRSYIYYPEIKSDVDDIECEHILIIIDACYSGSFFNYREGDERPGAKSNREKLIKTSLKKRFRKGISSGGLNRTKDGAYHSPFSDRIINALNSHGGNDFILTNNELFVHLEELTPPPQKGYFGEEDSDSKFLFIASQKLINQSVLQEEKELTKLKNDSDDWLYAAHINSIDSYQEYINKNPNGKFYYLANKAIKSLKSDQLNEQKSYDFEYDSSIKYGTKYLKLKDEGKIDEALKYLEAGRQKFPEDDFLLFEEINFLVSQNRYNDVLATLEFAAIRNPTNASIYSTLAYVHDKLFQDANSRGDQLKAKEHYNSALKYYDLGIKFNPKGFNNLYNAAAIRYNYASFTIDELNKYADDFSKEGTKTYNLLSKKYKKIFQDALPYFKKAESVEPNDIHTLTALKTIFDRLEDEKHFKIFKDRLERVKNGHIFEQSFYVFL